MDELADDTQNEQVILDFPASLTERGHYQNARRIRPSHIQTTLYEQPLNELLRVCLRLEMLFNKAQHLLHETSSWDGHACLATLIDIINLLDRPDLKAKLTQEFKRHLSHLSRLETLPHVDQTKLSKITSEISAIVESFHNAHGKLAQDLRENEFINYVRQHLQSPGGTCSFDTPNYYFWLQQPLEYRINDLSRWLNTLDQIQSALTHFLRLTRESGATHLVTAFQGFYQTALDIPCKLIQVRLPYDMKVFPEISAGRHRLCVRFLIPNQQDKPSQYKEDVTFELTYCTL